MWTALGFVVMLWLLVSCGGGSPGQLELIEDERFLIRDPSGPNAAATGVGCGETRSEAMFRGQQTARYNLRGVVGPGAGRMRTRWLRDLPEAGRICVLIEAYLQPR